MRITHVIAGLALQNGGPAYSVPRLRGALEARGCDVDLMTVSESADIPIEIKAKVYSQDFKSVPVLSGLRISSELKRALIDAVHSSDIIHNHGLWLMPNIYAGMARSNANCRLIVSSRGMLAPAALKFSSWKKKLSWNLLQRHALKSAEAWHATSAEEANDIRAFGIRAPIAIIPNGIDVTISDEYAKKSIASQRTILCLGRIHPKKNLKNLILAWSRIEMQYLNWSLRIVGPAEIGYDTELIKLSESLGLKRLSIEAPVFGREKKQLFHGADLFVLPTLNENFGLVVAEALAAGVPVISTKGAPWHGLIDQNCGWWIDHGIDPLVSALLEAMTMPAETLQDMGLRGRDWMERDFSWDRVAMQMIELYSWICGRGGQPTFVN